MTDYIDRKTGKGSHSHEGVEGRPNILLVTMDMVPPEFYDGSRDMDTPCQRSLAEEGVSYTRTFATSPLCGPSRTSILTGRFSYVTGNSERSHDGHAVHLRSDDIIWPEYLKSMGYHCRHVGKSHVGTEHFMRAFSENSSPWDRWSPPWYNEDLYIQFLKDKGLERFSFKKEIRGMSWDGERKGNSYGGWLAEQKGKPFPEEALYPSYLVERTISALDTRENRDVPFYMQLDFFGPHQPFAIPGGWEEREAEIRKTVQLPESWLAWEAAGFPSETDDPRVYDLYRKNWGMRNREDLTDYLVANQLQYEILDRQLGRLLDYLKEQNLYDNTMILFTADHGEMNGNKGCVDKGAYLNPQTMHVPLYLKPSAGQMKEKNLSPGTVADTPVSLLDICPTVCEAAGLDIHERIDGVSFFDTLKSEERPRDKRIMFDVWNHVVPNPCVGLVFEEKGTYGLYSYNTTTSRDELYRLDGSKSRLENVIDKDAPLTNAARQKMYAALSGDARWDVYNCYFKLEYAEELGLKPGDNQKFE
ncbi:MAG: sulfatase-like hydrolase/transferase [Spirochaetales bacterium]|nr:sulfatase-like hydrolase/transferase [Spirochaetales bacterium]